MARWTPWTYIRPPAAGQVDRIMISTLEFVLQRLLTISHNKTGDSSSNPRVAVYNSLPSPRSFDRKRISYYQIWIPWEGLPWEPGVVPTEVPLASSEDQD